MNDTPGRREEVAALANHLAVRLFHRFRERVPLATLRAFAGPAVTAAAASWDGRGYFAPYVLQRARWSVLDSLRKGHFIRRKPRDLSAGATLAAERAADALSVDPVPAPADVDAATLALRDFVGRAAGAFTVALDADEVEQVADKHADPEDHTERLRCRRAVEALPAAERGVIERHGYDGATFEEIAAEDGTSLSTVFRRYSSALEKLRRTFAE